MKPEAKNERNVHWTLHKSKYFLKLQNRIVGHYYKLPFEPISERVTSNSIHEPSAASVWINVIGAFYCEFVICKKSKTAGNSQF